MTRPIKFRAWVGKMEYDITVGRFGVFYVNPGTKGNGLDEKDSASLTPFTTIYPKETPIMQFTGLLDKNGKEIYEGDILLYIAKKNTKKGRKKDEKHYWEVYWDNKGMWRVRRNGAPQHTLSGIKDNHELVGNIYENPSLLSA